MSTSGETMMARIDADLKQAMRDRDNVTKLTLRSVKAAVTEASKRGSQHELSEDEITEVVQHEAKRRRDAATEFEKANRDDLAAQERAELAVLERYLPQQLTNEEIERIATDVIAETGAKSMRNMGMVMSAVMPRVAGLADGRQVNKIVRKLLSA